MLKANPKKKKAESLSTITRRLDILVSRIVRLRDKACVVCGSTQNPQCGHYIGRMFVATRWDLTNCHQQCSGCNMLHESDPIPYTLFIKREFGEKYPETLSALAHQTKVLNRAERLALEVELKDELRKLEALNE
jgi:hypothetical protein